MNANVGLLINSSEDYPSNGTDFAEKQSRSFENATGNGSNC
jgi:hypothetical protein